MPQLRRFVAKVLVRQVSDGCVCGCSKRGCHVVTGEVVRRFINELHRHGYSDSTPPIPFTRWLIEWMDRLIERNRRSPRAWRRICFDLIRLFTFERIELVHTCCLGQYKREWNTEEVSECYDDDYDEAVEIRSQQRDLLEQLEVLVREFHA